MSSECMHSLAIVSSGPDWCLSAGMASQPCLRWGVNHGCVPVEPVGTYGRIVRAVTHRASIRREIQIRRSAGVVWELAGDPARIHEWFPGIASSSVEGDERVVTLGSGQAVTEKIITLDPLQRRFQYVMNFPLCREHLGTLDVIEL